MPLKDFIFGKPLATSQERAEQIGPAAGIPIFGLDALSSAGYGPEAALTILLPLGVLGVSYIVPISTSIVVLLAIVYFSYLQTIKAYPAGGGSYTVARENLGESASLLAAAALMIDYILTAAVGISAGVGALVSALPHLQPHTLSLCIGFLLFIARAPMRPVLWGGIFKLPLALSSTRRPTLWRVNWRQRRLRTSPKRWPASGTSRFPGRAADLFALMCTCV